MVPPDRQRLQEQGERIRNVLVSLRDPDGNPMGNLLRMARQPGMWAGSWQANGVGYLEATERWVRQLLGEGVGVVVSWIDKRILELDDLQRSIDAGVAVPAPIAPSRLGGPVPGPPPPAPAWGGGSGFIGMDPAQVKRLCGQMAGAGDWFAERGRAVVDALHA